MLTVRYSVGNTLDASNSPYNQQITIETLPVSFFQVMENAASKDDKFK